MLKRKVPLHLGMGIFRVGFLIFILSGVSGLAQVTNTATMDTTGGIRISKLAIGVYLDTYYGYNFNEPSGANVPYFASSSRHNEFNINLALIDLRYTAERLRICFAPGFGTYVNENYKNEPGVLKNLIEARAGIKLTKKKDVWLDIGVLGSPYTNESAISKDHLMYTRSLAPEYVPYYLCGAKLSLPLGERWSAYLYLLNGWQQIVDDNKAKSIGTQIEWRPGKRNLFNWDTYIGSEQSPSRPDFRNRYFTDIYWIFNPDGKFSMTSCAYAGVQERVTTPGSRAYDPWYQANLIGRFKFNETFSLSGRFEYFNDENGIQIVPLNPVSGFSTFSSGLCFNIKLFDHAMVRFDGRYFFSDRDVYLDANGGGQDQMFWAVSNLTMWF